MLRYIHHRPFFSSRQCDKQCRKDCPRSARLRVDTRTLPKCHRKPNQARPGEPQKTNPSSEYLFFDLFQKDPITGQSYRIDMSQVAATDLCDRLSAFITYSHLSDFGKDFSKKTASCYVRCTNKGKTSTFASSIFFLGVMSESLNRTFVSNWLSASPSSDAAYTSESSGGSRPESLHSGEIRVDPRRRYFINFLRKSTGTSLLVSLKLKSIRIFYADKAKRGHSF